VGGPDAEPRRCQRDGGRSEEGSQTFINFSSGSTEILFTLRDILTNLCFQVIQNVTDKNYGIGIRVRNNAELVACCTKIIGIQYSQAVIENLEIYSALRYFTEVAVARECNPGPFLQSRDFGIELAFTMYYRWPALIAYKSSGSLR